MAKRSAKKTATAGNDQLRLRISDPEVSLAQLKHVVSTWSDLLREVASQVSGAAADAFRFVITDAKAGSFELAVRPATAKKDAPRRVLPRISKAVTRGLAELQKPHRVRRPAYFSDEALEHVKQLAEESAVGKKPSLTVSNGTERPIALTEHVVQNIDELIGPKFDSIGTVEGRLEGLIIHGRRRFLLFDALTGREVRCYFDESTLTSDAILQAFGKRISATGTIQSRRTGEKVSIDVRRIQVFPPDDQLPAPEEVRGILKTAGQ